MSKKSEKNAENPVNNSSFDSQKSIKEDKSFQILKIALDELKEKYNVSSDEVFNLIEQKAVSKEILIPISAFEAGELSALEVVCKYLKEELDLGYTKIASLLNRDSRTIWTTCKNALSKRKEKLPIRGLKFSIPISILADRKFSVLASIVNYLKDKRNLRYSEISALLNRDERNIWAAYNRYKKKK